MMISGAAGYVLRKFGYEMAPLLLALVLGDRLEENFRLALTMSGGSYAVFADRVSVIVLASTLGLLLTIQALGLDLRLPQVVCGRDRRGLSGACPCIRKQRHS